MSECPDEIRLSAYHDGELSPADHADVAGHLADCDPCVAYVDGLGQVSSFMRSADLGGLSQIGLSQMSRARLHRRMDAAMEQGLIRFGWELSGLAAAVLLGASAWLMWATNGQATASAAVPPWVAARTAAVADTGSVAMATPGAAWYGVDGDGTAP